MMAVYAASPTFAPPTTRCCYPSSLIPSHSIVCLKPRRASHRRGGGVQCSSNSNSNSRTPGPGSGENNSKVALDAFFLGKAFAEALNERVGSTVGEILSVVGQWQAEQQKEVQVFQEEVIGRAKKAKEKARLEVMEEQAGTSKVLMTSPNAVTPVSTPSSGPTSDDPLREMLKD